MDKLYKTIRKTTVFLLFIILTLFAVIQARTLLYPLLLSILLAFLLYPVAAWLEAKGIPRILSIFSAILASVIILGSIGYLFYTQIHRVSGDLPGLKEKASANISDIGRWVALQAGIPTEDFNEWIHDQVNSGFEESDRWLSTVFSATTGTLASVAIMPIYIFLLLYYRDKFYKFIFMVWPPSEYPNGKDVVLKISEVTKRYIAGVCTVVLILCVINTTGLYLIGLKYALFLGILSAVCSFIPYFGTLVGAAFPLLMAIFTTDSPRYVISVVIMYTIVLFTEHNILTPNITGGNVQVNPLVTIISIVAGGLVWGIPGMLAVIPFMGAMKILFESNPETQALAYLMGTNGTEQHAVTIKKIKAFFTRKAIREKD